MAKKENSQSNSHSTLMYLVAIVAIVAMFYMVQSDSSGLSSLGGDDSVNAVTGNVVFSQRADLPVLNSKLKISEEGGAIITVETGTTREPLQDLQLVIYERARKTQEVSGAEEGTFRCLVTKTGSYQNNRKTNTNALYGELYSCYADFELSKFEYETILLNAGKIGIQGVDAEGRVGEYSDIQDISRYNPQDSAYKFGEVRKQTGVYTYRD